MADALYLILEEAIDDVGESSEAPAMAKALRKEFAQLIAILERAAEEGVRFRFEIE